MNGPLVILKSTFIENTSVTGGAIHHDGAVGDVVDNGTFLVSNCTFFANEAPVGGAIDELGSVATGIVVNSLFAGNVANDGDGGALASGVAEAHGCTFTKNSATGSGGGINGVAYVTHCIFWDNQSSPLASGRCAAHSQKPLKPLSRVQAACLAPQAELGHVDAAIGGLTVVDPGLRFAHRRTQVTLREAGLFTNGPKQSWEPSVAECVLSLCRHATKNRCQAA